MQRSILGMCVYFTAILLMSYYFVGVSFVKAIQMASLITLLHILIEWIDMRYKKKSVGK